MGFYGSLDPTNSVKTLKKNRVLRIRLQSHQVHPNALTIIQHIGPMQYERKTQNTQINESTHSEMGPVCWPCLTISTADDGMLM